MFKYENRFSKCLKERLNKLSILILSLIFSPPCIEIDNYTEVKIYFSLDFGYFLYLQDGKFAWLFYPYTCYQVTLHGKDIVTYAQSTARKGKKFPWLIILQICLFYTIVIKDVFTENEQPQIFLFLCSEIFYCTNQSI